MISSNVIINSADMRKITDHINDLLGAVRMSPNEKFKLLPSKTVTTAVSKYELIYDPIDILLAPLCCVLSIMLNAKEDKCINEIFEVVRSFCVITQLRIFFLYVQLRSDLNPIDYGIPMLGLQQFVQKFFASNLTYRFGKKSCDELTVEAHLVSPMVLHVCFFGIEGTAFESTLLYLDGFFVVPRKTNSKLRLSVFLQCDIQLSPLSTGGDYPNPLFQEIGRAHV